MYVIRQMGHVAFTTPDVEGSSQDLVDLVGLKITGRRDGAVYLSSNERQYEVVFRQGAERRVAAVGLEAMDSAAVEEVRRRAQSNGLKVLSDEPLGPGIERAVRFEIPFGFILEVHTPVLRNQAQRHIGPGSRPRRLMPREARSRCSLPQLVERPSVASSQVLFFILRNALRSGSSRTKSHKSLAQFSRWA